MSGEREQRTGGSQPPRRVRGGRDGAQSVPRGQNVHLVPPRQRPPAEPPSRGEEAAPPLVRWLRTPRPETSPGVWRPGHVPKPPERPDSPSDRELIGGAVLAALLGWLVWSLCQQYFHFFRQPALWVVPDHWTTQRGDDRLVALDVTLRVYDVLFAVLLVCVFGRLGNGPEVWRRYAPERAKRAWRAVLDRLWWVRPARRQLITLLVGLVVWAASFTGNWTLWLEPLYAVVPDSWWAERCATEPEISLDPCTVTYNVYYLLYTAALVAVLAAVGRWRQGWREFRAARSRRRLRTEAGLAAIPPGGAAPDAPTFEIDDLLEAGHPKAAERLVTELQSGHMSDVDYARIDRVWQQVRARPERLPDFAHAVAEHGAGAFPHPSGDRDLPVRAARHDLLAGQVLIGHALDDERNPYLYRDEDIALDPAVLGTSLLAVGPPGSGKTGRIVRPVTEALCLRALTGGASVVAVGTPRSALGPDDAFDVIVRVGDPDAPYVLDPYGGATDVDEAAGLLAEALVGGTRVEPRAAAAVLVQLIGPWQAAYGQLPGVAELRAMLDGATAILDELRAALDRVGAWDQQRELDARARNARRPDDLAPHLADLLALLDRAGFSGGGGGRRPRPFSVDVALRRPLRVRVDLPAAGHTEAGRIVTRLLLAQFTAAAVARPDQSRFACLVLDDATAAVTPGTVRGLSQLRPANAGAVLALRTLDDVPKHLHGGLLGAVGCRVALSGLTTWDAQHFAEAWGTEWRETTETTRTPDRSGGAVRRLVRGVRRLFTGKDTTTDAVTVRQVERERWSASELAHRVPPRHAVMSLTTVTGEPGPPVLVRLG